MDFSSAYNDGFYNASNHPNYNAFATLQTNGSIMAWGNSNSVNTSQCRHSVAQLTTEKAKFLNLVIANESKCLILNTTNTLALGALNIVECWM
jgi:hypothetical protein